MLSGVLTLLDAVAEGVQYANNNIKDIGYLSEAMIHRCPSVGKDANASRPDGEPRKLIFYQGELSRTNGSGEFETPLECLETQPSTRGNRGPLLWCLHFKGLGHVWHCKLDE